MTDSPFSTFADGEDCKECEALENEVRKLQAENERLRAALEEIRDTPLSHFVATPIEGRIKACWAWCRKIAREALESDNT